MSELETLLDEREISYDYITEVDLFLENCSSLYNLILDAIHDLSSKTLTCHRLEEMAAAVADAGRRLVVDNPEIDGVVSLRVNTITSALEQLRIRKGPTSDSESCSSRSQGSSEIRNWIHSIEKRLNSNEQTFLQMKNCRPAMTKLLADQQVLQLEIQTEGQNHISRLYQQLKIECDSPSDQYGRKKSNTDAIRKKWHTVYLNSLSLQFRVEDLLNRVQEESDSESDEELQAPPTKRARRSSAALEEEVGEEEDTLPFAESEYESIMDGRATVTSVSSDESPARVRKWESVQQDIGYSSGENSVHEALNSLADKETPIRTFGTSSKMYYQMAIDDVTDVEVRRAMELKLSDENVHNQLSESMHVNYDQNIGNTTLPEFDEIMALMDEGENRVIRSESFNTQWKEIHGEAPRQAKQEIPDENSKHSCDASSEESDWESPAVPDIMSRSFNSAFLGGSNGSLKRQRNSSRKNSSLLEQSEMETSFTSTRSDLPPVLGRSLRRKLRVRRMPRSMSDGEQLGVKSGLLTPKIRISPPRTPLSSSTKLLQDLDRQLLGSGGETDPELPEHIDAPAYEWDDYKPPEKDDSMPDTVSLSNRRSTENLLGEDDDFGYHFSSGNNRHAVDESWAQLKIAEKSIENGVFDSRLAASIETICKGNLRNLDTAIAINNNSDISELRELRKQWYLLLQNVTNPANQLLQKIGRFGNSLRDIHSSNPSAVLNNMAEIKSKEDVNAALDAIQAIHSRLSNERDELRSLLQSQIFRTELPEITGEFDAISDGYDDAVQKINNLITNLKKLNNDWADWNNMQKEIRQCMSSIEERLKTTNFDQTAVLDQMEYCQERMNNLETMCNYLTVSLASIQDNDVRVSPDFKSEISLYINALQQLRSRFNGLIRVPTPPTPSAVVIPFHPISPIATSTPQKTVRRVKTSHTQTRAVSPKPEPKPSAGSRLYRAVSSSWLIKGLLALSVITALAAFFFTRVYGVSFGPHVTYIRGPPPV